MKAKHYMSIYRKKYLCDSGTMEASDVNITALLDILVVLLFFLILSFNPTDLDLGFTKNITMPKSLARDLGNSAVIIQITANREFYLGPNKIGSLDNVSDLKIIHQELKKAKQDQTERFGKLSQDLATNHDASNINLVFDQDVVYATIEEVMNVASQEGFKQFKLIVMPESNNEKE